MNQMKLGTAASHSSVTYSIIAQTETHGVMEACAVSNEEKYEGENVLICTASQIVNLIEITVFLVETFVALFGNVNEVVSSNNLGLIWVLKN